MEKVSYQIKQTHREWAILLEAASYIKEKRLDMSIQTLVSVLLLFFEDQLTHHLQKAQSAGYQCRLAVVQLLIQTGFLSFN